MKHSHDERYPGMPAITAQQFLALRLLGAGDSAYADWSRDRVTGRTMREQMETVGVRRSLPAFYQFMARLERSGYVTSIMRPRVVSGQTHPECAYGLTEKGHKAYADTMKFYAAR